MTDNLYTPDKIRTFTGKYIDPLNPDPALICIEDIAHALSMLPRFGGHTQRFYSVAQHSIACTEWAPAEHKLAALLHDASEAYLLDIPSPVKKRIPGYAEAEERLMEVIAAKFGFAWPLHEDVKRIDANMLVAEWEELVIRDRGDFAEWQEVETYFLTTYNKLKP